MRIGKTIVVLDVPIPAEIAPLRFAPRAPITEKERKERKEAPRTPTQVPDPVPAKVEKVEVEDAARA